MSGDDIGKRGAADGSEMSGGHGGPGGLSGGASRLFGAAVG